MAAEKEKAWMSEELRQLLALHEGSRHTENVETDAFAWEIVENQLLMKNDASVELGGGNLPAVSGVIYFCEQEGQKGQKPKKLQGIQREVPSETEREVFSETEREVPSEIEREGFSETKQEIPDETEREASDEARKIFGSGTTPWIEGMLSESGKYVTLYGADLQDLKGDTPYARVTLISLKEEFVTEEFKLYNLLRSIEYIRYHVSPRGYMPRISTARSREQVRVARDAVAQGLDFYKTGRCYEDTYLKHPAVEKVGTIFITLPDFDYKALQSLFDRMERAVMSLDHPLNNLKMDCSSCNLKAVCDEVENLCNESDMRK